MNISAVNNLYTPFVRQMNKGENNTNSQSSFGLKMSEPLQHDVVSFGATAKNVKRVINSQLGLDISQSAKFYELQISAIFMSILAPLISTDEMPDNIIELFKVRTKSGDSIGAKSGQVKGEYQEGTLLKGGRRCKKKDEISHNMTDILGAKAVLANGTKQNVKLVLDYFTNAIKNGQIRLREIEQKIPDACKKDEELTRVCTLVPDAILDKMKMAS